MTGLAGATLTLPRTSCRRRSSDSDGGETASVVVELSPSNVEDAPVITASDSGPAGAGSHALVEEGSDSSTSTPPPLVPTDDVSPPAAPVPGGNAGATVPYGDNGNDGGDGTGAGEPAANIVDGQLGAPTAGALDRLINPEPAAANDAVNVPLVR